MFTPDVIKLKQFYASPLGEQAARAIRRVIMRLWPETAGDAVLGVGYALPFLDAEPGPHNLTIAAMPAFQGAVYWPPGSANRVFLSEEAQLPLHADQFNRALLVHAAEASEQLHAMLEEVWRVLTPGGRMLVVVPNRRSFWARSPRSPFGYGRPFTYSQMRHLLEEVKFTVTRCETALHLPPLARLWKWRAASLLETLLRPIGGLTGGVLLVEAQKQIPGAILEPVTVPARRRTAPAMAQPAMSLKRLRD